MNTMKRFKELVTGFHSRLFLIFTIATGIISAAFVLVLVTGEVQNYRERSTEKAHLLASLLASSITLPLYSENVTELNRKAQELLDSDQVARIVITSSDNRQLVTLKSAKSSADTPLVTASETVRAGAASPSAESALSGVEHSALKPTELGSVTVAINTGDMWPTIRTAILKAGGLALLFWLSVIVTCYPILKRVTRSFDALTNGLENMMEGDFATRITINAADEAGMAAQAVNRLAEALEERDAENRNLQEELVNTMRLEVQEEKRSIMAKLIQTNRMTSLGLLISSLAHNINTPNGAIKLAAQFLTGSWKDAMPILEQATHEEGDFTLGGMPFGVAKGEIKGASESILNNADRVERVIKDLRAYNIGERNELSPGVSINRVVEEALTIIRAHGRQGEITITHGLAVGLPGITGNQYQLEQVVVNLLLNAMQAMPANKGAVTIRTEVSDELTEVRVVVTDEGDGIPPDVMKRLFEPFFSTRIDRGGSGLGLYISNFIVSEHKGRLIIDSTPGSGTKATVHLPVTATT